jgi:hypothetical protein
MAMRVVHISGRGFAKRESELLRRLEVGLIDEGVGVLRVRPRGLLGENTAGLGARVAYNTSRIPRLGPSLPARTLKEIDRQLAGSTANSIDVIHAWGSTCWHTALHLAKLTGADLVVSLHDRTALHRAKWLESRAKHLALPKPLAIAPDQAHAQALVGHGSNISVRVVPWGVHLHAGQDTRAAADAEHVPSICVVGSGSSPREIDALLDGLSRVASKHNDALVFFESALVTRHGRHWKRIRELGFETTPTLIENLESHRKTVLEADILVAPDSSGEYRSIVLEAMGSRMSVVVRRDPLVDLYKDDHGIIVVTDPLAAAWEAALCDGLNPDNRRARATTARRYIEQHHLAFQQVRGLIESYESLRADDPILLHQSSAR